MRDVSLRHIMVAAQAIQRCQERSPSPFQRAGDDLGMPKADASKALNIIEAALKVQIFERNKNGFRRTGRTTSEGNRLYVPMCRIATGAAEMVEALLPPQWLSTFLYDADKSTSDPA